MKLSKILMGAFFALAITACSDEPMGESTKHKPGEGNEEPDTEVPQEPTEEPDDIESPIPTFSMNTQSMSVNMGRTYQEIEGFGASDCWLPNTIGTYWTNERAQLARWLFSKNINAAGQPQGIGLSVWRVNLGAGTAEIGEASGINNDNANNRAESYLSGSSYDWNKCVGQRYFMQEALSNGVEGFVLFSNSPLVQYTLNGQGRSDNGGYANLKEDCYDDFAEYMADVAQHFTSLGYPIVAISPVNEPQYNWEGNSQEGSGWQNDEVAKLSRELDKALTQRGLNTEISIGEAGSWSSLYEGGSGRERTINAFYNPNSSAYVGDLAHIGNIICGHSYWTHFNWNDMRTSRQKVADAASPYNLRVWQTEWSMLDAAPEDVDYDAPDGEWQIAQYMSRVIHNDLTVANCTSWSYWTAMSVERWSQRNRFELIKTTPVGGNYSNDFTKGGKIEDTPNLWVLGNYSLFIRPGYVRVGLTHTESKNFFASAYLAPDNSKLVVVVTNYDKEKGALLKLTTPEGTKAIYTYTTTATKKLEQTRFNVKDQVFVDPSSVTTIVYYL
ncbi:MAG: beta-glycosidase [Muribaculaceae bacterium]|nr:beta-glycosidase [Muribaculaceae bacterium]